MNFLRKAGSIFRQTTARQVYSEFHGVYTSGEQAITSKSTKVLVKGLPLNKSAQDLWHTFTNYGQVLKAEVIMDRKPSVPTYIGYVTFSSSKDASRAIQALNGKLLYGGKVSVTYADKTRVYGGRGDVPGANTNCGYRTRFYDGGGNAVTGDDDDVTGDDFDAGCDID